MKKRIFYLDLLKIVACFLVIVNHCIGTIYDFSNSKFTNIFYCVNFSICKMAVPLFIMTTGALLLKKQDTYITTFKRILRVLIPLLIMSFILYFKDYGFTNFITSFMSKPIIYPYWYLYMLISLYLVTPLLQKMLNNFKNKDYIYLILITLIIPVIIEMISKLFGINISNMFYICIFSKVVGIYILGYYLSICNIKSIYKNISIISLIVFGILYFLTFYIPYINTGKVSYLFDTYDSIFSIVMGASLFYLFRYIFKNNSYKCSKIINIISGCTFGIYLFHFPIIYNVLNIGIIQNIFKFNIVLGVYLLEVLIFIICGIVTYILKCIPYVKKVF